MSRGVFTDRSARPTEAEIREALGKSLALWEGLLALINAKFKTSSELKFYGKNYGWALAFKKAAKSFVSLYPSRDTFAAQVIMKDEQIAEIPDAMMSANLKKAIDDANPYPEGRWLFIPVATSTDVEIVEQLLVIKAKRNA